MLASLDGNTVWHATYDPFGFVDGPNVYAYVNSDPLQATDFEGLDEHHIVPRAVWKNVSFEDAETRRVFDRATIEVPPGHWNRAHYAYNNAVRGMLNEYCEHLNTKPSQLTPRQARDFVFRVWNSSDLRVRGFNTSIMLRGLRSDLR